jgi:hypothetical protein
MGFEMLSRVYPQEARNMACNQFIPAYVAEAYMAGGPATRHAACAALWAVYGVSAPPNGKSFTAERSDAPPVCQSDGVNAYHKGRMVSEVTHAPKPRLSPSLSS